MKNSIQFQEEGIAYSVRVSKRARCVRISVHRDGTVLVTQPAGISFLRIKEIVSKKIDWIARKLDYFKRVGMVRHSMSHDEYMSLREEALTLVKSRIEHYNALYRFSFEKITIRNQKTRWGSCSRRGTLSFNCRVTHLPKDLVDYIVVHELCHLAELNHSKNYWKLVERAIPRYKESRKTLKHHHI